MSESTQIQSELKEALDLDITEDQVQKFLVYYQMILDKNKVMNLTRITDFDDFLIKHIIDSLSIVKVLPLPGQIRKVFDLGSGAGFPGMPIRIVYPQLNVTMVDSVGKKVTFLQDVIRVLGLEGTSAIHARAEEAAHQPDFRECFDLCVSRAVANLATLSEYCLPFVRTNGYFISYKSVDSDDEVHAAEKAVRVLGGKIDNIVDFDLFDMKRRLILIRKIHPTPERYPRKAGTPSREPIC